MEMKKGKIYRIILIIIGVIGILDTIVVRDFVNGMDLGVLLPSLIGIACILWSLKPMYEKYLNKVNPVLRRIVYWCFLLFLFLFITVEGAIVLGGKYIRDYDIKPDYILVLGAGIYADGNPTPALEERLLLSIDYANRYPEAYIVVSGGQGKNEPVPEAHAMAQYLIRKGISPDRIIIEDKATSTMENFKFTKELIDSGKKIAFITNDFHVLRSTMLARRNGLDAYGYGTPTPGIVLINCYLREFFAMVKSFLFDHP
ncbi:hypothetical protein Cst_c07660 [Thermoclostridium stercorarium subsp. stercorarium DSM 8532]|jgi:uncharacterized SAM-binding protein YcdF (DUF218 family)|uniref:DUF218 domain-containing protein n=3 Tax=Thermoclostridium stercorarium TaxID=1510 RepID=L7VI98_THES1|nr:YdcF family protein [Thermoclostridium stercorarium]AGC67770.1 hypothetical protein Cst_c07660 [Thermoclostridium stercorarium subsp. stercorarium DSM 8532]AGI38813.1 hypothetical protein Clst_0728 [Thermoclostridium stercorarium subsp. stercorarium DSM 8532]ANW98176.1 hypothetical protein CSTERTH_03535 [Thermoclostridium stercorarium subsp. thermolacticum DSM 2910]ANX00717.1 hypothetical protein CSTERLE_03500 [Thermoclostridium stercorarium subsp. leptospartum DSM 9219]UZQ86334.1 YdcF fami